MRHNECGHEFYMCPKSFLHDGQRCPNERYAKSAKTNMIVQGKAHVKNKMLKEICEKEGFLIKEEYKGSNIKITMKHLECGHEFEVTPYSFLHVGTRCPKCKSSKGEKVIREYLKDKNIKFKEQYKIEKCKNIRKLPFDFAVFDNKDNLLCLIEYDGTQHFHKKFNHSEKEFMKLKENDNIKNDFCKKNGILLIRIKYVRSSDVNIFNKKVIERLEKEFAKYNMVIPNQASEETPRRCRD